MISVIRPGRGDITTTRVERNTASAIECVTNRTVQPVSAQIRSSSPFSRSRVISSSAPKGSSIRSSAGENESARAIATRCCMPPESCHGCGFSKPVSSTSSTISLDALLALRAVPAEPSRAAARCSGDRAPVVEHRVLEDDAVVAVAAGLVARSCRSRRPRRELGWIRSPTIAQQRRLAAARRADQRDELAGLHVEVDLLQRGYLASARRSSSTLLARRRRRRSCHVLRGAPDDEAARRATIDEERDAEQRGDEVRRPEARRRADVVLVEVEDRAAEAVLDRRRQLADDRADDARGGRRS